MPYLRQTEAHGNFNPRSREGSDSILAICRTVVRFQSTLPRRERQWVSWTAIWNELFQSTLPRRERQVDGSMYFLPREFQSTLPRRERPWVSDMIAGVIEISIHAPAKGATPKELKRESSSVFQSTLPRRERLRPIKKQPGAVLFQSTLPRRERRVRPRSQGRCSYFNPRSREGSDGICGTMLCSDVNISIHAPAKGATDGY